MNDRFLAEMVVPGEPWSVPLLRRFVGRVLAMAEHRSMDGAQLIVSELAGNAIVHTRSGWPGGLVAVEVTAIGDALARIEVTDEGALTVPCPRMPGDDDCHGRGLNIVEHLAVRWGIRPEPLGWTTVWAEVLTAEEASIPVMDVPLLELEA
ncbi:ATP-binding protein [Nonomuraea sp. NPDC046802]|uniref:ATP-binding protein n=1 Tax=Nonomuraea sp. NPDC046802 TaxID=3154919 RepID=UPI0033C5619D